LKERKRIFPSQSRVFQPSPIQIKLKRSKIRFCIILISSSKVNWQLISIGKWIRGRGKMDPAGLGEE